MTQPLDFFGRAIWGDPVLFSGAADKHHADRYSHSVSDSRKIAQLFNSVTERVTEIEQHAFACFLFVAAYNVAFD